LTLPAVVAGALGMGSAVVAFGAEPTTEDLKQQIEQLQTQVQKLEQKQDQQVTAREVDATVQRVIQDAEKRSQLLQMEGFTAGWNDGFKIQSADGNFLLQPYFGLQIRNVTTFRDGEKNGGDEIQNGFEIRRMKFGFRGNAFTPDLTYNFNWETSVGAFDSEDDGTGSSGVEDGTVYLENAYVQYFFSDDWAVKLGQWKDNWTHEETVSDFRQLAVDRSLMNELIGGGQTDYVQGISLIYAPRESKFRAEAAFIDGYASGNTDFQDDPSNAGNALIGVGTSLGTQGDNFGFSGRFEYAVMGNWKEYDQFTAMGATEDLLVLGTGFNWTQASSNNVYFYTVDAQWLPASVTGLSVYGALVGLCQDLNQTGADGNFTSWGFLLQAGYMVNEQWEVFGRVDYTDFDDEGFGTDEENEFWEATMGVNYYFRGQAAKFTVDLNWLCNGAPDGVDLTGIGYQPADGSEVSLRAQFQLLL
jgi:hypothetical protein